MHLEPDRSSPVVSGARSSGEPGRLAIQDVSAWILRGGVLVSVGVMMLGLALSFGHQTLSVTRMRQARFVPGAGPLWRGLRVGSGQAVIELGILLLVFTPILRVFTSMLLFLFEERDRLYALVTFLVLVLTMAGLLLLRSVLRRLALRLVVGIGSPVVE